MRRVGTDESNVQMADVLCDFCAQEWSESRPMVEGHLGACICGSCLSCAYRELVQAAHDRGPGNAPQACTMCREERSDPCFTSPARAQATICQRCTRMAAKALARDPDSKWTAPLPDPAR